MPFFARWGTWLTAYIWYADSLPRCPRQSYIFRRQWSDCLSQKMPLKIRIWFLNLYRFHIILLLCVESYCISAAVWQLQEFEFRLDLSGTKAYIDRKIINPDFHEIIECKRENISDFVLHVFMFQKVKQFCSNSLLFS